VLLCVCGCGYINEHHAASHCLSRRVTERRHWPLITHYWHSPPSAAVAGRRDRWSTTETEE